MYDNTPEGLHPNMDLPEKQWFKRDSEQTRMENPEDDKYNFSGWSTSDVEVDNDGKFDLNTDVTFHGSWEIKPSYQVQANYLHRGGRRAARAGQPEWSHPAGHGQPLLHQRGTRPTTLWPTRA
ncbi:MAG: hypothetical protein V8S34_06390 [Lawsonibacter sp.]